MVAEALTSDAVHLAVGGALVAVALAVVYTTDRPSGAWTRALRSRFLLGVPWGTLVAVAGVVGVYLFVQSGLGNPDRPVVIPFRSWSYLYPEGLLWSSFAHASRGHITGNLLSALVAGGIAEYAYGHFPGGREVDGETGTLRAALPSRESVRRVRSEGLGAFDLGRIGRSTRASLSAVASRPDLGSLAERPGVRAFVVVPGAMALFGVVSALFALGPVIGFSGVVFALWGFALVFHPVATIAALTGATLVDVAHETLRNPVVTAGASGSYGPPGWANVAIQGHALGLITGIVAGAWLLRRRKRNAPGGDGVGTSVGGAGDDRRTAALVAFGAVLLFGASRRLWAVYWYLGNQRYELYRALGVGLLALLAAIVALAVAGRDEPLRPDLAVPEPESIREAVRSVTPAAAGVLLLASALAVVAGPGVVPNLVAVDDGDLPGDPIEVEGYQVTYAENVENRQVSVVDVEAFGRSTSVNTSGVIVQNADREIWATAVSRGNLAFWGYRAVDLGGTGWRETVWVQRVGWVAANGGPTYRVDAVRNETRSTLFTSEPARAEPRIDGRSVTVAAVEGGFELRVDYAGETETAPLPAANESVTLHGVTFVQERDAAFAVRGDTRVRIAERETYEGRQ
ncbi:rhomboid family intramembrane serine protease [Halorubrum sp. SD626R]|uniref:rhomboid family intramembrane serine protease n=1 Tax=Halorubrum sp. SD626R TaxID=1419722 RepID=UPI000AAB77BA|nr:rhomboid family intramembrane serine protease [Halorubrum sp. SD626R]TKX80831.1 rhomboid family intramembrane serine protease [Halorubrum sp. SD626R]